LFLPFVFVIMFCGILDTVVIVRLSCPIEQPLWYTYI